MVDTQNLNALEILNFLWQNPWRAKD